MKYNEEDNTAEYAPGRFIYNIHPRAKCKGPNCVIHNPSDHHMRDWPLHWREDRGIFERICPHGVGHPDPDDISIDTTHGCDGCCKQ
tara:strand:+ start:3125 stop:3385 length:261 start_codon:yes stop_codon:yes gene_type:complete